MISKKRKYTLISFGLLILMTAGCKKTNSLNPLEGISLSIPFFDVEVTENTTVQTVWALEYMAPADTQINCNIDWGDGSEEQEVDCGEKTEEDEHRIVGTAEHTYDNDGSYQLQLTASYTDYDLSDTKEIELELQGTAEYLLSVTTSGDGLGIVNSTPAGIDDCSNGGGEVCQEAYTEGTEVTLTATSDQSSIFAGWSGDCADFREMLEAKLNMNSNRNCDARFNLDPLSDVLPTGLHPFDHLSQMEGMFYLNGSVANGSGYKFLKENVVSSENSNGENVSFGDLNGMFITAFSGAEGYVIVDLLDGTILLDKSNLGNTGGFFGIAGATQTPAGPESNAMLLAFGATDYILHRNSNAGSFDTSNPIVFSGETTFDAYPAGGNPLGTNMVSYVQPNRGVKFYAYTEAQDLYVPAGTANEFDDGLFEGQLVSAYIHSDEINSNGRLTGPVLVLTRDQQSGLYLAKWDGSNPVRVTDLGLDARKVRCVEDGSGTGSLICIVSVFGDDRLAILSWDGENEPDMKGFVDVGDGPVGIDLKLINSTDNIAVVSTGFNDNTVTLTTVSASGTVEDKTTWSAPDGCSNPGHAILIQDAESWKIAGTCYNSDNYFIIESGL